MKQSRQQHAARRQRRSSASSSPLPDLPDVDWRVYAGCWVALIRGRVAGVGHTAEAARLAARHSRPRERIDGVYFVPPPATANEAT